MTTPAITTHNLTVYLRHISVLSNISFEVQPGSITGLIGPSGAGKTTLMRCLVGRQRITEGNLTVLGYPAGAAVLRSRVTYMTQQISVYPDITTEENLTYFATMVGIPKSKRAATIANILKTVDMTAFSHKLVSTLSGGQRQRVSLAIALLGKPKLLVLDEPTVGLDPVLREELWGLFRKLASEGATLIISSHVMDEAEHCDDLLLIRDGTLLAHGSPHELRMQTHTDSVEKSFLKLVRRQS